jgi:hypothetical protein
MIKEKFIYWDRIFIVIPEIYVKRNEVYTI